MNKVDILKIEKGKDIVLLTEHSRQSMAWTSNSCQILNINNEYISPNKNNGMEITCEILTETAPNVDLLTINDTYFIYSLIYFKFSHFPNIPYIKESIIKEMHFRPILDFKLVDFSCTNNQWKLNFKNSIISKVECVL